MRTFWSSTIRKNYDGLVDGGDIFHLEATKFPTSGEEEVHISVREWN